MHAAQSHSTPSRSAAVPQLAALDHFSVRWDGDVTFIEDDAYIFSTFAEDGSRLFLDGESIIDRWDQCCVAFSSPPVAIANTKHIRYEMHVRNATNHRNQLHFQPWLTLR